MLSEMRPSKRVIAGGISVAHGVRSLCVCGAVYSF